MLIWSQPSPPSERKIQQLFPQLEWQWAHYGMTGMWQHSQTAPITSRHQRSQNPTRQGFPITLFSQIFRYNVIWNHKCWIPNLNLHNKCKQTSDSLWIMICLLQRYRSEHSSLCSSWYSHCSTTICIHQDVRWHGQYDMWPSMQFKDYVHPRSVYKHLLELSFVRTHHPDLAFSVTDYVSNVFTKYEHSVTFLSQSYNRVTYCECHMYVGPKFHDWELAFSWWYIHFKLWPVMTLTLIPKFNHYSQMKAYITQIFNQNKSQ